MGFDENSGYADRKMHWSANDAKRVGMMLNMKPEEAMEMIRSAALAAKSS